MEDIRVSKKLVWTCSAVSIAVLLGACGGSSTSPSGGSGGSGSGGSGGSGGGGGSTGTTITITSSGISPKNLTVVQGTQVTFVNNDSRNHTMNSDPHPEHTNCQEINSVGFLTPGQNRQTGAFNTVKTCGYHDHELFQDPSLQGSITITAK